MQAGKNLGDYILERKIGNGSLGEVYLAQHRFIKRYYVLKILPKALNSDKMFIKKFEEMIQTIATVEHPNLVKVHNVSFDDNMYFLVTDCLVDKEGETCNLAQYLANRQEPLSEDEIYSIADQVAKALDFIHQSKINDEQLVHQNIKLNNILISQDFYQAPLNICVSDVGLAHIVGLPQIVSRMLKSLVDNFGLVSLDAYHSQKVQSEDHNPHASAQKSFYQGYMFLAPEQKSKPKTLSIPDYKTDIYAFGVLLYYLMTQSYPEGIFHMPRQIRKQFNKNWDLLIWHCLQKNPKDRPKGLQQAMELYLEDFSKKDFSHQVPKSLTISSKSRPVSVEQVNLSAVKIRDEVKASGASIERKLEPATSVMVQERAEKILKPILKPQAVQGPSYDPDPSAIFKKDLQVTPYQPRKEEKKHIKPLLTDMVILTEGDYYRGCDHGNRDEMPKHKINLKSFALDIHPVTNEQFILFLQYMGGGDKDAHNHTMIRFRESRIRKSAGVLSIESGYSKHPIVGVTWYGANAYAKWIGKRMVTEAEWEVSALGGLSDVIYPCGDTIEKSQSNFFSSDTTPVKSYATNGYGLYDMVGNIYEWCQDWYGYNYYEVSALEPENPRGPLTGVYRVLRGGCWKSLKEDLRCSHRHRNNPGTFNKTYGFRCAADVN